MSAESDAVASRGNIVAARRSTWKGLL